MQLINTYRSRLEQKCIHIDQNPLPFVQVAIYIFFRSDGTSIHKMHVFYIYDCKLAFNIQSSHNMNLSWDFFLIHPDYESYLRS